MNEEKLKQLLDRHWTLRRDDGLWVVAGPRKDIEGHQLEEVVNRAWKEMIRLG